ncbi:unnamed protein product [Sympodiomycopsis kandeliae]
MTSALSEKTNIKVVFGTMTFGKEGTEQSRVFDLKDCQAILDAFKSHGHTELDSARAYCQGTTEEYLASLKVQDQGFVVATKNFPSARNPNFPGEKHDHTKAGVEKAINKSLQALNTSCIDLYYLHAPDREVSFSETLEAINEQHKQGKFKQFGISNYKADEVEEIMKIVNENNFVKPTVYQGLYNSIARAPEKPLIPVLRKHGIAYYCYNPLGGGFFTGRITAPEDSVESGSRFDPDKWQGQMYRKRYYRDEYFKALKIISDVSKSSGLTMPEIALRWMQYHSQLDRKYNDAIIIGASSLKHIEQNLLDMEKGPLPQDVLKAVEQAWEIVAPNAPPYHF